MRANLLAVTAAAGLILGAGIALAQEPKISFPIAELGGCTSKDECKAYCDQPGNGPACLDFAEKNGLMSKAETAQARKFVGKAGPGGCMGNQCREYCSDPKNLSECRAFAQKNGLMPPGGKRPEGPKIDPAKEAEIIKKVQESGGPGGCRSKDECMAYCDEGSHMNECMAFAKENGLMKPEEIEQAKKMIEQTGPGGCRGRECRTYCEDESHATECLEFGEKQGLISKDEAERARQVHESFKEAGPGGCTDQESCRSYCSDPANGQTCQEFAQQRGFGPPIDDARGRPFDSAQGKPPEGMGEGRPFDETRGKPPFDDRTESMPKGEFRQRPTPEQEAEMRKKYDEEGARQQNMQRPEVRDRPTQERPQQMMPERPFDRTQGEPFDPAQGRPFDGTEGVPQDAPPPPPPPPEDKPSLGAAVITAILGWFGVW